MADAKPLLPKNTENLLGPADKPAGPPPPEPPPQPSGDIPSWGVSMTQETVPPPPPPPSPPPAGEVSQPPAETLVIPPTTADIPKADVQNPFIPQETVDVSAQQPPPPPAPSGSIMKKVVRILVILLILVGLGFGVKYAMGLFTTSREVTLTYWGLWENDTTVQAIIADFQKDNPNIKISYVKQSPRQYRERLQAAITRGEGPDIFRFHNTWVPMLRNELLPAPAEVMSTSEFSSTFYPVAAADLVGGQSIYGLPLMIDGLGLFYNEDILTTAGVVPPTTWPEVLDVVPKLTVKSDTTIQKSAIALGTTGNVENFSDIVGLMMMQNGARIANPVGKEAEDTLLFYRKFATPSDPVYTWNASMDNSIYAFATGRVAMILAPSWRAFEIKQISPNLKFKITQVPQLPGNTVNWASYWVEGVSAKSKFPEEAWAFVKYVTGREAAVKLYTEASSVRLFGEPYARVDLGTTITEDPYVGAFIKQAPTAKSFPLASRTFDNGLNDKLIKYVEDAVNAVAGGTAPTAALETVSAGFRQVLGSYGLSVGAVPTTTP